MVAPSFRSATLAWRPSPLVDPGRRTWQRRSAATVQPRFRRPKVNGVPASAELKPRLCRWELTVVLRAIVLMGLALLCTACVNDDASSVMGYQAGAVRQEIPTTQALSVPARKTMADKVLTAIALERVTGRKPDPARLVENY